MSVNSPQSFLESKKFPILNKCVTSNSPQSFQESKKFPILNKCVTSYRAVNFLGNLRDISGSFLETVRVWVLFKFFPGNFLKSVSLGMYLPP